MKLYPQHRADIYQMRLDGLSAQTIADLYGVARSTINNIIKRESGAKPRVKPIVAVPPAGYEPVCKLPQFEKLPTPPLFLLFEDWIRTRRSKQP